MTKGDAKIELVMSEFGHHRANAGGATLPLRDRLNPTLHGFRGLWPKAVVTLYTDQDWPAEAGLQVRKVDPPFDRSHPRYGWRAHDYYQIFGLLNSTADVAVAMDSDMEIVSSKFGFLTELAKRFGLTVPINPRMLLGIDGGIGVDSTYEPSEDPSGGVSIAYNLTPIAFSTDHQAARRTLEDYAARLAANPGRGAVHLSAACLATGFQPHVLPYQWCVSSPRDVDSKHIWSDALALHVGHADVIPRFRKEQRSGQFRERFRRLRAALKGDQL